MEFGFDGGGEAVGVAVEGGLALGFGPGFPGGGVADVVAAVEAFDGGGSSWQKCQWTACQG